MFLFNFSRLVLMLPIFDRPLDNQMVSSLNSGHMTSPSSGSEGNYKQMSTNLVPSSGNSRNLNGLSVLKNLDLLRIKYFQAIR